MLDIETMGNSSEAAIMSIGACCFDPDNGEIGDTFHEHCSLQSSVDAGLKMDTSTILWWMQQSDDARSKFYDNEKQKPLGTVLMMLREFIGDECQVWGNGATFDNTIIKNAYKKCCSLDAPWKFWNDRDVRTIVELGPQIGINPKRDMPFDGIKHDALADAIHQAKYVSLIWQRLINGDK
jgi:exodeoxyribonuclease VIII